jgi:hypothetical protein
MGINIYSAADPSTGYSVAGAFTNPFTVVLDGKYGGVIQKKLYVRNSDSSVWYSATTLLCSDIVDPTIVDGTKNITWKLIAGNTQPTDDQWAAITTGNTISMANLGAIGSPNTSTYLPFWARVQIPRNMEVQTVLDVKLKINTTESSV